ncbi:hypothetical protein [Novosphingobium sp.]|uniref:hypothetical protein n=1 Tax=Novosphingobium sp. TaxID=1874826 RepID=UPI0038B82481
MARRSTALRKIKIMISSQCNRAFPAGGKTLTEIRQSLRYHLEQQTLLGNKLFEVWINENSPGRGTNTNSWDTCLAEVRKADILIVLAAGHAGWASSDGDIGICHAELMTAHNASPAKIRIIKLEGTAPLKDELAKSNERFRSYVDQINPFRTAVASEAELQEAVDQAVADAVTALVGLGGREAGRGRFADGDALAWSRLSLGDRASRMRDTMSAALRESGANELSPCALGVTIQGQTVVFHLHAAPGSIGVPAIREMVGRPFLDDHRNIASYPADASGPIHIIAGQAGVTEAQARTLLGFPDATFVTPGFGIFAADNVQQIQFALLKDCRDDTTTRNAVHRLLQWLRESGEDVLVAKRATRRKLIAETIAAQTDEDQRDQASPHPQA